MTHDTFVDDDERVLSGICREVRGARPDWELSFASNSQEALARFGWVGADVVVSDTQMPEVRLAEDLFTSDGRLLLATGAEVTRRAHTRIFQYSDHVGIREQERGRVPA